MKLASLVIFSIFLILAAVTISSNHEILAIAFAGIAVFCFDKFYKSDGFAEGGTPPYKLPFVRLDPNYSESRDFKNFIQDEQKISNLHSFLQTNSPDVLKYIVAKSGQNNITVLDDAICDYVYHERMEAMNEILMGIETRRAEYDDPSFMKEEYNEMERKVDLLNDRYRKSEKSYANYDKNSGKIIQSLSVAAGDNNESHATSILVDFDREEIIYLDPHFDITTEMSYNCFLQIRDNIIKAVPRLGQFWYGNLSDAIDFTSNCPVFQGSFKEKIGLCPFWNIYLLSMFCINDQSKFLNIVDHHLRNVTWTQRNLQEFLYIIYTHFADKITKVHDTKGYNITGKMTVESAKGKYDCEKHGWLWFDGECYSK